MNYQNLRDADSGYGQNVHIHSSTFELLWNKCHRKNVLAAVFLACEVRSTFIDCLVTVRLCGAVFCSNYPFLEQLKVS